MQEQFRYEGGATAREDFLGEDPPRMPGAGISVGPGEEGRRGREEVAVDIASGRQVSSFSSPDSSSALENVNTVKR